ncbi:DUF7854 family protein [Halanaeroarchaeum sulfurireducens]|uniref:Uncharacterized protein n=1 Tax=Halanaeroarchaeum sulfurireducens TaxID=1604004 RepID=A0A0F7P682_9EURY|nr:hypothetical protein [Halanaeroarchaeum sulfurireducens]AKH96646.1 hypothetical protein HLASF_0132 [Halanaeroarchaeum sulfurireducens]ALG81048.1 hypothetical protein HLASA_0132 [Halanaeroarchaeum sulfurireducens]
MDRIAAIRNVEDALAAFERGEIDLETMEERVQGILRTYATEYPDDGTRAYRASGDPRADGLVVLASDRSEARERLGALLDGDLDFEVEPLT